MSGRERKLKRLPRILPSGSLLLFSPFEKVLNPIQKAGVLFFESLILDFHSLSLGLHSLQNINLDLVVSDLLVKRLDNCPAAAPLL